MVPPAGPVEDDEPVCGEELDWLEQTKRIRMWNITDGHGGFTEVHLELSREWEKTFSGVLTVAYRARLGEALLVDSRPVSLADDDVKALFASLRAAIRPPTELIPPERRVIISDTSRTTHLGLELTAAWDAHQRVIFETDHAEDSPAPWRIRSCGKTFTYEAQKTMSNAYSSLSERFGAWKLLQQLPRTTP